jgi:hypothetical protein
MYKRPNPRVRGFVPQRFVSVAQPGGGVRSQWISYTSRARVPTGTPGVVGTLIDKMRAPPPVHQSKDHLWTPSYDYEFIAERMSEAERGPWIQKCRDWYAAQPKPVAREINATVSTIDHERIVAMYRGEVPPIATRVKVYRAAGCSEEFIRKAQARAAHLEATSDERQKALDAIFAKWPAASKTVKPKGKPATKVIKAVKKKL